MAQADKAKASSTQQPRLSVQPLDPNAASKGEASAFDRVGTSGTSARVGKTRTEVKRELYEWRQNPVTVDGWREVGGETGWVWAP